ncbi:MAG: hypothetical protein ACOY3D_01450, partial [Candidatus Omnitrophota bacterium]
MEKRVIIASLLVFAILLGYGQIINKLSPPLTKKSIIPTPIEMSNLELPGKKVQKETSDIPLEIKYLETKNLKISFCNKGGKIREVLFKNYHTTFFPLPEFSLSLSKELPFKFVEASAQKIVLVYENGVQKIIKEFRVKDDQALEVRIALLDQGKVAEVVDDLNLFNIDSELAQQSREFKKHRSFLELAISLPDKL